MMMIPKNKGVFLFNKKEVWVMMDLIFDEFKLNQFRKFIKSVIFILITS